MCECVCFLHLLADKVSRQVDDRLESGQHVENHLTVTALGHRQADCCLNGSNVNSFIHSFIHRTSSLEQSGTPE